MAKNMELENTSLKMAIFMRDKCTREKCKEKASIHGPIKMFFKVHLFKIKWTASESLCLQMEMLIRDNLLTTEHVEMVKWLLIQVTLIKVNLWTILNRVKVNNTWKMETFTKVNFTRANGTVVARSFSPMLQSKKVCGFKTKSNDIFY